MSQWSHNTNDTFYSCLHRILNAFSFKEFSWISHPTAILMWIRSLLKEKKELYKERHNHEILNIWKDIKCFIFHLRKCLFFLLLGPCARIFFWLGLRWHQTRREKNHNLNGRYFISFAGNNSFWIVSSFILPSDRFFYF